MPDLQHLVLIYEKLFACYFLVRAVSIDYFTAVRVSDIFIFNQATFWAISGQTSALKYSYNKHGAPNSSNAVKQTVLFKMRWIKWARFSVFFFPAFCAVSHSFTKRQSTLLHDDDAVPHSLVSGHLDGLFSSLPVPTESLIDIYSFPVNNNGTIQYYCTANKTQIVFALRYY